jgi:hypothetical protein
VNFSTDLVLSPVFPLQAANANVFVMHSPRRLKDALISRL